MIDENWEDKVRETIEGFPSTHRDDLLKLWHEWLKTDPQPPLYESWSEFALKTDDLEALYTERRIYLKRVTNELKAMEIPLRSWQKIAKALGAVASVFLIVFLAISRVFRVAE
ncbi:MAG: hypothetical protein ACTSV3_08750 [Candidatus Thorarchaeota archaeon]|nr:MAG: hypothetical protein DRP09_11190 [Candidatus Thorarchaeota archaeon]RLI57219.1 MAG: hypothetical protein DRO87_07265 [Candidatus Thorarchaeota archaeon]